MLPSACYLRYKLSFQRLNYGRSQLIPEVAMPKLSTLPITKAEHPPILCSHKCVMPTACKLLDLLPSQTFDKLWSKMTPLVAMAKSPFFSISPCVRVFILSDTCRVRLMCSYKHHLLGFEAPCHSHGYALSSQSTCISKACPSIVIASKGENKSFRSQYNSVLVPTCYLSNPMVL